MHSLLARIPVLPLLAGIFLLSCSDDEPIAPSLPDTYNFTNVDYSGQLQRIQMLDMLIAEVRKANDGQTKVLANDLIAIYENHDQLLGTSKKLEDKTHTSAKTGMYEYFNQVENLSGNQANVVGGYLVSPEGIEPAQMIAKGLMGALLYWQAVDVYLGEAKMNVDNSTVTEGQGTAMQHHWDEAFGYFGVPKDFPANDGTATGATAENKAWFWGHYSNQRASVIDVRQEMMDAFIKGRAAIDRKDLTARDEAIATIRENWDLLVAANVVHYLNQSIRFNTSEETGRYYHNWSEAKAFAQALLYNPDAKITATQYGQLQNLIGTNPQTASLANLQEAALLMQQAYGFTNDQMERL